MGRSTHTTQLSGQEWLTESDTVDHSGASSWANASEPCLIMAGTSQSGAHIVRRKPVIQGEPAGKTPSGSRTAGWGRWRVRRSTISSPHCRLAACTFNDCCRAGKSISPMTPLSLELPRAVSIHRRIDKPRHVQPAAAICTKQAQQSVAPCSPLKRHPSLLLHQRNPFGRNFPLVRATRSGKDRHFLDKPGN
jgi:hypothetical protein